MMVARRERAVTTSPTTTRSRQNTSVTWRTTSFRASIPTRLGSASVLPSAMHPRACRQYSAAVVQGIRILMVFFLRIRCTMVNTEI